MIEIYEVDIDPSAGLCYTCAWRAVCYDREAAQEAGDEVTECLMYDELEGVGGMGDKQKRRQEVAESLRTARPHTYYAEELVETIKECLGPAYPVETWREPTDVLGALADLIDPTCERDEVGFGSGMAYCTACRHLLGPDDRYCPRCGARVLHETEGDNEP